jgi:hypothetical protein
VLYWRHLSCAVGWRRGSCQRCGICECVNTVDDVFGFMRLLTEVYVLCSKSCDKTCRCRMWKNISMTMIQGIFRVNVRPALIHVVHLGKVECGTQPVTLDGKRSIFPTKSYFSLDVIERFKCPWLFF